MKRGAAIAHKYMAFNNRFTVKVVVSDDAVPGQITIRAHPHHLKEVKSVFSGDLAEATLTKISETTVDTAFNGIVVASLVAGKGPTEAVSNVFDRALPDDLRVVYLLAQYCKLKALLNLRVLKAINAARAAGGGGGGGGGGVGTGAVAGAGAVAVAKEPGAGPQRNGSNEGVSNGSGDGGLF